VIGLDINPLAVSVARAELLIAFKRRTGELPNYPPHVYHADTIAMLAGFGSQRIAPKYFDIIRGAETYLASRFFRTGPAGREVARLPPSTLLASLSWVERAIFESIKLAERRKGNLKQVLHEKLVSEASGSPIEDAFRGLVEESDFALKLSNLVAGHGDGVWAPVLMSAFVPLVLENFRPHLIVYRGLIRPFSFDNPLPVLLSAEGEKELKEFLQEVLAVNEHSLPHEDSDKLEKLILEVKQPKLSPLNRTEWYTVYRCQRTFTACVVGPTTFPSEDLLFDSHVSGIVCKSEKQAYYYAAVLNWLAFKVVDAKRTFIRDQFAKPLDAIVHLGLSWNEVDKREERSYLLAGHEAEYNLLQDEKTQKSGGNPQESNTNSGVPRTHTRNRWIGGSEEAGNRLELRFGERKEI
jgi:hypothetical protein